jgi:hypothetical protein
MNSISKRLSVLFFAAGGVFSLLLMGQSGNADKVRIAQPKRSEAEQARLVNKGRYLAAIGACAACHTPPDVGDETPAASDQAGISRDRTFRTEPDWFRYLDPKGKNYLVGGVPFHLRFSPASSGTVFSLNITPAPKTGLEKCEDGKQLTPTCWTEDELIDLIRTGQRKDGSKYKYLYLFPPHTFYSNLAKDDARSLAVYLRSIPPVENFPLQRALADRKLPADQDPKGPAKATGPNSPPVGRSSERAEYLTNSLVGCRECHSHTSFTPGQTPELHQFAGGDKSDPFLGVFRLGPDLPLRPTEKGFAVFPYPGYAVLYSGNLTRFGLGGDLSHVSSSTIVRAIRRGVSVTPDSYGRNHALSSVMLWQFYAGMTDDDAYSIAEYLKSLVYEPPSIENRLILFGDDWQSAFRYVFGNFNSFVGSPADAITDSDRAILGKQ